MVRPIVKDVAQIIACRTVQQQYVHTPAGTASTGTGNVGTVESTAIFVSSELLGYVHPFANHCTGLQFPGSLVPLPALLCSGI